MVSRVIMPNLNANNHPSQVFVNCSCANTAVSFASATVSNQWNVSIYQHALTLSLELQSGASLYE